MSSMVSGVGSRYQSRRPQIMTFIVTRQAEKFSFDSSQSFCDIALVRASVQLMGDPPPANKGTLYGGTTHDGVEELYSTFASVNGISTVNNASSSSVVRGVRGKNAIELHSTHIMHDWVSIAIDGMMQPHHFLRDNREMLNNVVMICPTDMGVPAQRPGAMQSTSPDIRFEAVKLERELTVHTSFLGKASSEQRIARFVEDYADTNPSRFRNPDGSVNYYEEQTLNSQTVLVSQIPSNMINCIVLEFLVTPRIEL